MKLGISVDQAHAAMEQIRESLAAEHPAWFKDVGIRVRQLVHPSSAIVCSRECGCCLERSSNKTDATGDHRGLRLRFSATGLGVLN